MTTVMSPANRQAFLQALREDQDFREEARALLLTPEVLKLPEQVAALTERLDQFIAAQEAANAAQQEFNAAQREFNAAQQEFNRMVESRLSSLETQVGNLTEQVGGLNTQVGNLTEQVGGLNTQVGNLTTQVGDLQGTALEFRVQNSIHSLIFRRLGFTHTQVLRSQSIPPEQSFHDFMWDAVAQNRIVRDDIGRLLAADLLLRARLPDSTEQVHVAVEVSRTVDDIDITRARERADLLAAAAGTAGRAVVIGTIIPEPQRQLADAMGVAVFHEE